MVTRQEQLFDSYVEDLSAAKSASEDWWRDLLDAETSALGDRDEAIRQVRRRWRRGPASHPRVIAVIRKYFMECQRLNEFLESDDFDPDDERNQYEEIYPQIFLTEWLLDGKNDELGEFIADLPYWPIGMNEDGDYV